MIFDAETACAIFSPGAARCYRGWALLAVAAGAELLGPWPVKWLVDHVFDHRALPAWMTSVWPGAGEATLSSKLAVVCIAIVVIAIVHRLLTLLAHYLIIRAGTKLVLELRARNVCAHSRPQPGVSRQNQSGRFALPDVLRHDGGALADVWRAGASGDGRADSDRHHDRHAARRLGADAGGAGGGAGVLAGDSRVRQGDRKTRQKISRA